MPKNKPFVVFVGASGSGKTTLCDGLGARPGFYRIITSTSRPPRDEADDAAYHRTNRADMKDTTRYALYAELDDNAYAVRRRELQDSTKTLVMTGQPSVLLEIKQLCMELGRDLIVVHLQKPMVERQAAMLGRGDSSETVGKRLANDNLDEEMQAQTIKANLTIREYIDIDTIYELLKDLGA